jgi:hypothetical protein
MIDWNVRIGDLAVISSLAGTCIFYAFRSGRFAESIMTMQKEITELKDVAKSMIVIITNQAVQTVRQDAQGERLNILDRRIEDLRKGDGFIMKRD